MKALVTGSAGFAGRHYVRALQQLGYEVTGIDITTGRDARDYFRYSPEPMDVAVHCAAIVGGRAVIDGSPLAQAVNLELDAGLFQWAERTKPGRVLYISSSAVYPVSMQREGQHFSLCEEDIDLSCPELPDQLYGWAKLTGEILAARYRQAGGRVTVIRPFSGYGEDQDESYPFRAFAERAKRREDPFVIWGSGSQVRDFIHIEDVVRASLGLVEDGIDGPVNLGSGEPVTMLDLAMLMCQVMGYQPEFEVQQDKPKGVGYRVANVKRMSEYYAPLIGLEEGVRRAVLPWPL